MFSLQKGQGKCINVLEAAGICFNELTQPVLQTVGQNFETIFQTSNLNFSFREMERGAETG